MNVWIVVPAFNEGATVGDVVRSLTQDGYHNVMVVDDGSADQTSEEASKAQAVVIRHIVNRGAGAATVTGMTAALRLGADVVVTFDGDGQHRVEDIGPILEPIERGEAEVVLGYREKFNGMPFLRKAGNSIGNVVTWLLSGIWVKDSQSGFRAYTRRAMETMNLHANGYEFCTEVIREMHHRKLAYVQVPIVVRYTPHSLAKGQNFDVGVGTLVKLVVRSLMR
jgi:glycosyltransferase involved in cell wall biosynthesis